MSPDRPNIVDREIELTELRELSARPGSHMALIYGRRRVGKTYLLDRVWDDDERFYFLVADATADLNRHDLLLEFGRWSDTDIEPDDYPSWRTTFRMLAKAAEERPMVVVLDEFQFLMESDEGVASQLNAIWDREVGDADLTLVLCGSEVATIEQLERGDSPLYGRINWRQKLRAFDYYDAGEMVPGYSPRDKAYAWGVFGGIPQYLSAILPDESVQESIRRNFLSSRGEVHLQLEHLIEQERGIRNPGTYRAVLDAVAAGHTETNKIAQAAGLQGKTMTARRALNTLQELELVAAERNFGDRGGALRHRISENATRFWHRFVSPNRSRLEMGHATGVWEKRVEPHLDDYMGKVFEVACRQAVRRHFDAWQLPAPNEVGRWEGTDRNRRSIEIDLICEMDDGHMLTGEVKWSSSPMDVDVHFQLLRDLDDLSHSGKPWARRALDEASHGHIYFSAAGFTEAFRARASDDDTIRLVTLADMYSA
jgi:hypothetical protein